MKLTNHRDFSPDLCNFSGKLNLLDNKNRISSESIDNIVKVSTLSQESNLSS